MASILDTVRMAQRASSASGPQGGPHAAPIEEARKAAIAFFSAMPDVRRTNIVKLVLIDPEQGEWEAEAEVHVPNATIKVLGLPLRKEVLDCQTYLLRLDGQLNVTAYGRTDSVQERGK